jgi:hypothetical protein
VRQGIAVGLRERPGGGLTWGIHLQLRPRRVADGWFQAVVSGEQTENANERADEPDASDRHPREAHPDDLPAGGAVEEGRRADQGGARAQEAWPTQLGNILARGPGGKR